MGELRSIKCKHCGALLYRTDGKGKSRVESVCPGCKRKVTMKI